MLSGAKLKRAFEDRPQIVTVPAPTLDELASQIRDASDMKIAETDYFAMPDYPLSDEAANSRVELAKFRLFLQQQYNTTIK